MSNFSLTPAHYGDVIMDAIASQITSLAIVYSIVYSDADQRKHQSSASLAFVRGIHRGPVNSPHKWPVTRKMFPFDDVIMDATGKVAQCGFLKRLKPPENLKRGGRHVDPPCFWLIAQRLLIDLTTQTQHAFIPSCMQRRWADILLNLIVI